MMTGGDEGGWPHAGAIAGQCVLMPPSPPPGGPGAGPGPAPRPPRPWPRSWRTRAIVIGVFAVAALTATAAAAASRGTGPGGRTQAVSVSAGSVTAVDLQGVPGQLTIAAAATGHVTLTGHLNWTGRAAAAGSVFSARRVLHLSYRCAAASPCTADLRLVVPARTAITLRQPSGHVVISGLAGPLRITASSVNVSATGLRCPSLDAVITSGHLGATFDAPPREVGVSLTSAQATLLLPAGAPYAVTDQVISGYIHVGVPQDASAPRAVTAQIISGELDLQAR
jgi:hypothetical protein